MATGSIGAPVPFRFVHTADIHLDSPLRSLALRDEATAHLVGAATRQAFTNIVDLCLTERVDALTLGGDITDGDLRSIKTASAIAAQLRRLHEASIPVFAILGNHDARSKLSRDIAFPPTATLFEGRSRPARLDRSDGPPVVVHGISFAQPEMAESLLPKYAAPVEGAINIGLMHTSLDGAPGHDTYAPCALSALMAHGYNVWGLGHIHKRAEHQGATTVIMPGNPQARHINEGGAKSVTLVTVGDDRRVTLEERAVDVARFARLPVDLTGCEDWTDMLDRVRGEAETALSGADGRRLILRPVLSGRTVLSGRLRADDRYLDREVRETLALVDGTALDKLVVETRPPGRTAVAEGDGGTAVDELRHLIALEVHRAPGFRADARTLLEEVRNSLPPALRGAVFADPDTAPETAVTTSTATATVEDAATAEDADAALLDRLIADGTEDVLARLDRAREPD